MNRTAKQSGGSTSALQWRGWRWLGVLLVPLLIAAAFLAGSWGVGSRSDKIKAAVVNNDQAVTINDQYTPLGRQLAAALANRADDNVTWVLSDTAGAEAGLKSGEFAAVVTIPQNFSAAATSFAQQDQTPQQATIEVRTSDAATVNDAALAQQLASMATSTLNGQLTGTYLDNIYVGFNTMGQQFVTLAKAADQLATGASGLATGAKQASTGTKELDSGMQKLAAGGTELKGGLGQLTTAGGQLTSGGSQLTASSGQLTSGSSQLATGANQLATGSAQLATGVSQYTQGTQALVGGLDQYAAGVNTFAKQLASGSSDVAGQLKPLSSGASQVAKGADGVNQMAQGYAKALAGLATSQGGDQVEAQCQAGGGSAEYCAGMAAGYNQGWKTGVGASQQAWDTVGLPKTAAAVAGGADQLKSGVNQAVSSIDQAASQQSAQLNAAVKQLANGANQLASQSKPLVSSGKSLASGAQQSATGAKQLASGADQLNSGLGQYTQGVSSYVTGVNQYVTGVNQANAGAVTYIDGVAKVAQGTPQLAAGMAQLSSGAEQLSSGTTKFAQGLKDGQSQVPSYTGQQRKQLSTVVSAPVTDPTQATVGSARIPLTIAVLAIGLWLGAMVLNLVRRPVPADALASTASTTSMYLRTMAPGAIFVAAEAVLLTVIGSQAMDLGVTSSFTLLALLAVAGLAFVAINQALAAWFPTVGRVLAVVLATAAVAVSVTAAIPGVFGWLHAISPLKPALDGVRAVVTGESLVAPIGQLLTWTIVAVGLGIAAIARHRSLTPASFLHLTKASAPS